MANPLISVMICCYNSEQYLYETINSVVAQTYTNWEIVAINDGSTDNTEKIIFDFIQSGHQIIYHKQKNAGFAAARNKALELATGEWIAIIDHDDNCLPGRLEIQMQQMLENPGKMLFYANTEYIDSEGVVIGRHYDRKNPSNFNMQKGFAVDNLLRHGCFIDTESVMFNKAAALNIGGFNSKLKFIVDYDFFIRMSEKYNLYTGSEVVSQWRIHDNQTTKTLSIIAKKESIELIRFHLLHSRVTLGTRISLLLRLVKNILH
jgi:glycosyltransferase involved in cell wall biosynthesis